MKTVKKIFVGIVVFLVVLVIVSFFLPSKVHVERSIVMNVEPEVAFNQVNNLKNWEQWSPWDKLDPTMGKKYEGPEAGANAKFSWDSKNRNVMKGSMLIKDSKPNESIGIELTMSDMDQASMANFKFEKADKGTKVTWNMDMDMGMNPAHKYAGLFMDKLIGPDFEKGLKDLKEIAEKLPPPSHFPDDYMKVITTTVPQQSLLMVHLKCHGNEISKNLGEAYGKIGAYAGKNKANMANAPMAIYQHWENDNYEFDAACAFDKKLPTSGDVKAGEIKAGNVVMTNYYGSYDKIGKAHEVIKEYLKANNKKTRGDSWEVYANDPMSEKDTMKWHTQIYYPVD